MYFDLECNRSCTVMQNSLFTYTVLLFYLLPIRKGLILNILKSYQGTKQAPVYKFLALKLLCSFFYSLRLSTTRLFQFLLTQPGCFVTSVYLDEYSDGVMKTHFSGFLSQCFFHAEITHEFTSSSVVFKDDPKSVLKKKKEKYFLVSV